MNPKTYHKASPAPYGEGFCRYIAILLFFFCGSAMGQSPADWWYFGVNAGIHFTPNGPVADVNGQLATVEGCASISDNQGNLLFYTDGITVYDAQHNIMPNGTGLLGHSSSTQSAVAVPYPGQPSKYYIFTVPVISNVGLRYTIVDMTLNSGWGDVDINNKNILVTSPVGEKVTAVKHANGQDYWVLTAMANSSLISAFHVSAGGVNTTAVSSTMPVNFGSGLGYLKASPKGTMIAAGIYTGFPAGLLLAQFNNQTGVLSNAIHLPPTTFGANNISIYGIEFSPNDSLVYAGAVSNIHQLSLSTWTQTAIGNSLTTIPAGVGIYVYALQLGPDDKIYCTQYADTFLAVINNPNIQGAGCNYVPNAVSLAGKYCQIGLPTFMQSFFNADVEISHVCLYDSTSFTLDTAGIDSVSWNFDDPASGTLNYSTEWNPKHIFSDTGTYTVTLTVYHDSLIDSTTYPVYIYPHQQIDLGPDTALCVGLELTFSADQPFASYLWSTGSTDSAIVVTADSIISITVTGVCDTVSDSVHIDFYYPFIVTLGSDTSICSGDTLVLDPVLPAAFLYSWNTGSTTATLPVSNAGTYSVTVSNGPCEYADTIAIDHYPLLTVSLGHDTTWCYTDSALLTPSSNYANSFSWSTGATTPSIYISETGTYTVTVSDDHCFESDEVIWMMIREPVTDLGNDTSFCSGDTLVLATGLQSPVQFFWNTGDTTPSIVAGAEGTYWVEVSNLYCSMRDTVVVGSYPNLTVSLGEDLRLCEGDVVNLVPVSSGNLSEYKWSDGSTSPQLTASQHATYGVTVTDGLCYASDHINLFYFEYPHVDLGPDTAICSGAELELDVSSPWQIVTYLWHNGYRGPVQTFPVTQSQNIRVSLTNVVCTASDSIYITMLEPPAVSLPDDTTFCEGAMLQLTVAGDSSWNFTWGGTITGKTIQIRETGLYVLAINDGKCSSSDTIRVWALPSPTLQLEAPEFICIGEQVTLDAMTPGATAYRWQDGTTHASTDISAPGIYSVTATHACGVATDTVVILDCECFVRLPSAFHPDGDRLNDFFSPVFDCALSNFELKIFNRWGQCVFSSNDPGSSWDGMQNGTPASPGTYAWKMRYKSSTVQQGKWVEQQGTVLLMR